MPDPAPADVTPAPATPPAAAAPWHTGVDAEILGHWQNKGWSLDDPKNIAVEATRAHRKAEGKLGVPADELLRMPKPNAPEAEVKAFWRQLGAPAEPKEYDFADVKFSDGTELEAAFSDSLRAAFSKSNLPKSAANEVAKAVVKYLDDADQAELTQRTQALNTEREALKKSWGQNFDMNRLSAMQGAKRLGLTEEVINTFESVLGYSKVMEMFRLIGTSTNEDTFVEGGNRAMASPATQAGAVSRLAELQNDSAWRTRLLSGDVAATREFHALTEQVAGYVPGA